MKKKVNIYCPTYHRFEKTKESIESIIKSVKMSSHDVMLYVVDNNSPQAMREWLEAQKETNVSVELLDQNIGKGQAVNSAHSKARKSDYVISIDSDIVNKRMTNWIDIFVEILNQDNSWGVIACDYHDGLNVHVQENLNKKSTVGKYQIKHGGLGIGGGVIIMRSEDFDKIGGYITEDIFIGDDGRLMAAVVNDLKKKCGVCEDVCLYHPIPDGDLEKKYQHWKNNKSQNHKSWNKAPNTGFYENQ
jgi:GT2 family glycosyltransferase